MNAQEIKNAVDNGENVYWSQDNYKVIKDSKGEYLIKCSNNNHCIGLTWADNQTLNGKESEFYIKD